jgi:hypothetical protein
MLVFGKGVSIFHCNQSSATSRDAKTSYVKVKKAKNNKDNAATSTL